MARVIRNTYHGAVRIEALRVLCDLVDEGSFTAAARRHFITQSAVSQQIRALERELKSPLLFRRGGRWELTDAGRLVHRRAVEILARMDQLAGDLRSLAKRPSGRLRVATAWSVGLYELPRTLPKFLEKHPDVDVEVEFVSGRTIYDRILERHFDLGIIVYPHPRRGLKNVAFATDRLVLATGLRGPLHAKRIVAVDALDGVPLIQFHASLPTRPALDQALRREGLEPRTVRAYLNIEMIRQAVEANLGAAFLPQPLVRDGVKAGRMKQIRVRDFEFRRPLAAVYRVERDGDPLLRTFIEALGDHFGE